MNWDLEEPVPVSVPEYLPLTELPDCPAMSTQGLFVDCPACDRELRIDNKYRDQRVRCKHCAATFDLDLTQSVIELKSFYTRCPHCEKELRAAPKYLGEKVACKYCESPLRFTDLPVA